MGLDLNRLKDDILAAMDRQMPPDEELTSEAIEFGTDLATAIDRFVRNADVTDVRVRVGSETYDQTGTGELE